MQHECVEVHVWQHNASALHCDFQRWLAWWLPGGLWLLCPVLQTRKYGLNHVIFIRTLNTMVLCTVTQVVNTTQCYRSAAVCLWCWCLSNQYQNWWVVWLISMLHKASHLTIRYFMIFLLNYIQLFSGVKIVLMFVYSLCYTYLRKEFLLIDKYNELILVNQASACFRCTDLFGWLLTSQWIAWFQKKLVWLPSHSNKMHSDPFLITYIHFRAPCSNHLYELTIIKFDS